MPNGVWSALDAGAGPYLAVRSEENEDWKEDTTKGRSAGWMPTKVQSHLLFIDT